jgi:hypothetical protein
MLTHRPIATAPLSKLPRGQSPFAAAFGGGCAQNTESFESAQTHGVPFLKALGLLLLIGGIGAAVYFVQFYDTSVDVPEAKVMGQTIGGGRVHNVGLMQNRQTGIIVSVVVAVAGLACMLLGQFARGGSGQTKEAGNAQGLEWLYYLIALGFAAAVIGSIIYESKKVNEATSASQRGF